MKNKLPHDSDFEQYIRQALQKTDGAPDENTWTNIAAQQSGRNIRLQIRHYGLRFAPVVIALILAFAGWKYFGAGAASPADSEPIVPQQMIPAQKPQADVAKPQSRIAATENSPAKGVAATPAADHPWKNTPATVVLFSAEEGLRYENPATGTSVFIPANSLVRADGKPAQGEVEFELREYRNIPEYLSSGIPMHYADERGSFFFNSGGMFDLRVNQNGEQLQLASGQGCDVQFTSTHKLTDASLYYFDENKDAWTYQPDPAFTTSELPPVVTEATAVRNNRGIQTDCLPNEIAIPMGANFAKPWDEEATDWMQVAIQTGYDYAFGKKTMPGWFRKHSDWTNDQLLSGLERSTIRMKRHKDTDEMFFPEDLNNVFTELKAFKDCYFIINKGLGSKKSFTKEELDSYWERVSVVPKNGAVCYVSFFGKQGLLQFYATLVGSTENESFDAEKVLAEYARLRNERQQNFDQQANAWRRFTLMAQIFQEPEEWCMDAVSWFDYFEANLPLMRKRYAALKEQGIADDKELALNTWKNWEKRLREVQLDNYKNSRSFSRNMSRDNGLRYALTVTRFGLYNCDQIFNQLRNQWRGQDATYVFAAYKSADGQQLMPRYVTVIEPASRLYFTLPANQMVYVQGRRFDLIMVDKTGRYFRLPGERYAQLDLEDKKSHTFTVEDVTEKIRTPRDWAELLEI